MDEFEPRIRSLPAEFPDMPTTVIMERVGRRRGKAVFFDRVAQLRPLFKPPDPASRTEYQLTDLRVDHKLDADRAEIILRVDAFRAIRIS